MKTLVFVYEPAHIEELSQLEKSNNYTIIACNEQVAFLLESRGIVFRSGKSFRTVTVEDRLIQVQKIGAGIFKHPSLSFFSYKGISLSDLFIAPFQFYLAVSLYYLDIVASALEEDEYRQVIVFTSLSGPVATGGLLHSFDLQVVVDAVRLVCEQRNIPYRVKDITVQKRLSFFAGKRMLFAWGIRVLGWIITAFVSPKKIRILASEQWKNISPFMADLPDTELFLLDRTESLKAGFSSIIRNRMRFTHISSFVSFSAKRTAQSFAISFIKKWKEGSFQNETLTGTTFRGIVLQPQLERVLERILVVGGEKAVLEIESIRTMYGRISPDVVLVRAGVSAQTHFAIMCVVARQLGIPSLEIQHGTLYVGSESLSKERTAEYIAEYGPLVRKDLTTIGYDDKHLFDIGSPRFDLYNQSRAVSSEEGRKKGLHILFIAPRVAPGFWADSFDVHAYFAEVLEALRAVPGSVLTIKLRPGRADRDFYEEILRRVGVGVSYRILSDEPLAQLFESNDVIVSCYSTALTEALLSEKPTIYFSGFLSTYKTLSQSREIREAAESGALIIEESVSNLSTILIQLGSDTVEYRRMKLAARSFMASNYSFDGKSATRLATVLRKLAKK